MTYRKIATSLENHPNGFFSLCSKLLPVLFGHGLAMGMARNARYLDKLLQRTYVLFRGSEMTGGQRTGVLFPPPARASFFV